MPLTTLLTFNRLKVSCVHCTGLHDYHALSLPQALSSDKDCVLAALREATGDVIQVTTVLLYCVGQGLLTSDLIPCQVSEDGGSVRRHPDRPTPDIFAPEVRKEIMEKSVYTVSVQ